MKIKKERLPRKLKKKYKKRTPSALFVWTHMTNEEKEKFAKEWKELSKNLPFMILPLEAEIRMVPMNPAKKLVKWKNRK